MRAETQEAMRMFLGGRCYTAKQLEKDYLSEVAGYSDDRWEAPQRAARLAAAVKRYKTSEMLRFIFATIAGLHWAATLAEIEREKRNYQTQVKASRKGEG